jgi:F420H(2)-dependent quinone reductase
LAFRRFKRWLYRGGRPNALARALNRGVATVHALGIAPNYLVTLVVMGRRSGRAISFPLVMARVNGERYLVSMLGTNAAWVRNIEARAATLCFATDGPNECASKMSPWRSAPQC